MYINRANTVSEALSNGLHYLTRFGRKQESRNGDVLVAPAPVMTIYANPLNRVLFSPVRDANPFFHLMESIWMLAGRNDLPWICQFNSRFNQYSDDGGKTQPAAYGYRWRNYFGYDQLETIITELKHNPQTRRAVLAMWDGGLGDLNLESEGPTGDLLRAISGSNDVPCNTHVYFDTVDDRLNMTVCCRSNDIIWGAYGANAVHLSFLLEYVATATGLPLGVYRQLSNNFHMYTGVVAQDRMMEMARDVDSSDRYRMTQDRHTNLIPAVPPLRGVTLDVTPDKLFAWFDAPHATDSFFLDGVTSPARDAYYRFKNKDLPGAIELAETIKAEDWRIACVEWLLRRQARKTENG